MRSTLIALVLAALLLGTGQAHAAESYKVDSSHSMVIFKIKHLGVSYTYGRFNDVSGTFKVDDADPAKSSIEIEIKADSIDTNNKKRDDHLRGPDFFNVRQFPKISFKSKKVKKTNGNGYEVTGDLTLHGVTKTITLKVERVGAGKDPWGGYRMGFNLVHKLNRSDYDMKYMLGKTGIGDEVQLSISIEGIRKKTS